MNNVAECPIPVSGRRRPPAPAKDRGPGGQRVRCRDARWPTIVAALSGLRAVKRHSVRIVDADCERGNLLLCAVRHARAIGFTAIEARGIGGSPAQIRRARAAAAAIDDPAIGISFEADDLITALEGEADFPADILVWHGCKGRNPMVAAAVASAAARTVIADPAADTYGARP